ncbi:hypothetical protein FACS189454_09910 [Planctomycetales bacterium]|nr:hypothetical protein FACS189454_09910 [Planctomycetales bacterium]
MTDQPQPIRVCFVLDFWKGRAGVELQLLLLLKHIDRSRVEPFVVVLHGSEDHLAEYPSCPVFFLKAGWLHKVSAFGDAKRFRAFLKTNRIGIIQALQIDNTWTSFVAVASRLCGIKAFFTFRVDIGFWINDKQAFWGKLLNRFVVNRVIANAEACKKIAVEREKAKPENVIIIPNLIETRRFEQIPLWSAMSANPQRRVGIVGNLKHIKGTDVFIDAAKIVLERFPDVHFDFAGNDTSKGGYPKRIDELGISNNVHLLGSLSDIPAFLAALDIAVLASRTEGLPNAIMEYMAAGRPCVTTDVGGCGELIHNEENGLLVPPENPAALAAAICDLLTDSGKAERFAAKARNDIATGYDADVLANRWCEVYETMCR